MENVGFHGCCSAAVFHGFGDPDEGTIEDNVAELKRGFENEDDGNCKAIFVTLLGTQTTAVEAVKKCGFVPLASWASNEGDGETVTLYMKANHRSTKVLQKKNFLSSPFRRAKKGTK